jgi:hypothetical protein
VIPVAHLDDSEYSVLKSGRALSFWKLLHGYGQHFYYILLLQCYAWFWQRIFGFVLPFICGPMIWYNIALTDDLFRKYPRRNRTLKTNDALPAVHFRRCTGTWQWLSLKLQCANSTKRCPLNKGILRIKTWFHGFCSSALLTSWIPTTCQNGDRFLRNAITSS